MAPKKTPCACMIGHESLGDLMLMHLQRLDPSTFSGPSEESVLAEHAVFFGKLLKQTPRVTKAAVGAATDFAFPGASRGARQQACNLLPGLLSGARRRASQVKTGERTPSWLMVICRHAAADKPKLTRRLSRKTTQSDLEAEPERAVATSEALASIEEMYGLRAPSSTRAAVMIDSSSEQGSASATEETDPEPRLAELHPWWSVLDCTFKVMHPKTQDLILAEAKPGADGYVEAWWPDGSVSKGMNVPNLALAPVEMLVRQKPAAAMKKPAAALKKPAAAAEPAAAAVAVTPAQGESDRPADAAARGGAKKRPAAAASPAQAAELDSLESCTDRVCHSDTFGRMRKFVGKDKAYIQYLEAQSGRWRSVCNVTGAQCRDKHGRVVDKLMHYAKQRGLTRLDVETLKAKLCEVERRDVD